MYLKDFLTPEAIIPALKASSKKQVLQSLAHKSSQLTGIHEHEIIDMIMKREKLGSTALGNGAAIPHEKFTHLDKICGVFAKLEKAVEFESLDEQPVDLVFLLLAPENAGADHLKALSCIARLFRNRKKIEQIRRSNRAEDIYALLTQQEEVVPA